MNKKHILILLACAILANIPILFAREYVVWDGAAYLMNAKGFLGEKIYFEEHRPPLFPLLLSIFYWILPLGRFIPILFSILIVFGVYFFTKKIFSEKTAFIASILAIVNPELMYRGGRFLTDIPATFFIFISYCFFYLSINKKRNLIPFFVFFTLAYLTRYSAVLCLFGLIAFVLISRKTKEFFKSKYLYIGIGVFFLINIPWLIFNQINYNNMFYSPIQNFLTPIFHPSNMASPFYYIINMVRMFGAELFLIVPGLFFFIKKFKEDKFLFLYLSIIILFLFQSFFPAKDTRYIMPTLLGFLIFGALFFEKLKKDDKTKNIIFLSVIIGAAIQGSLTMFSTKLRCYDEFVETARYLSTQNVTRVSSPQWPVIAFYGNIPTIWNPADTEWLDSFVVRYNISHFVVGIGQGYLSNKTFFDNNDLFEFDKQINGGCFDLYIYRTKK